MDVYFNGTDTAELIGDWRPTTNTHGSGCVFAAAITAALAQGEEIAQATQTAKHVVTEAIRQATDLGQGNGPVNALAWLKVKK